MLIRANDSISVAGSNKPVSFFDIDIFDDRIILMPQDGEGNNIGQQIEIDYACLDLIVSRLKQEGKL